jgi:molecular chaperone GrpE
MATNTMDNDVDPSTAGERNDPASEIASLRERLMRALADTENTRRQGEPRVQDAQQFAITNFARELLQVVDNLRRASTPERPIRRRQRPTA